MKRSSFVFFIFMLWVAQAWGTQQLIIKANEIYTVTPDQRQLFLKSFQVGDNAIIRFAEGVERWQLEAADVSIGRNVTIEAIGYSGVAGQDGASFAATRANACQQGQAGEAGESGTQGGNGVAISMRLVIEQMGDLTIKTQGGVGGAGGHGGNGQDAGETKRCHGAKGGQGGQGGNAGQGGNGGHVRIVYNYTPQSGLEKPLDSMLTIVSAGGQGGKPGQGGKGGKGSEGRYINQRTLTGNKKWLAGGEPGKRGGVGQAGREGLEGQVVVERDLGSMINALASGVKTSKVIGRHQSIESKNTVIPVSQQAWQQMQAELRKLNEALERSENNYQRLQKRVALLEKSLKTQ